MYVKYVNRDGVEKTLRLTHMVPAERLLTEAFLKKYSMMYSSFDANVLVGTVAEPRVELPGKMRDMYNYLSAKKIDLVGYHPEEIHTFEVKLKGGHSFYSQVLLYPRLYQEKYAPEVPVRGAGICAYIDADIEKFIKEAGALIFVFRELEYLLWR